MRRLLPIPYLVYVVLLAIPATAQPARLDSTQAVVGSLAAWDIEFHAVSGNGSYLQDLRNPYDDEQRAIGVFDGGRLMAYHLSIHGNCFVALPARLMGGPSLQVEPYACNLYRYFDEQLWLIRSRLDKRRLEALVPKKVGGTDY